MDIQLLEAFKSDLQAVCERHSIDGAFFLIAKDSELFGADVLADKPKTVQVEFLQMIERSVLDGIKSFTSNDAV